MVELVTLGVPIKDTLESLPEPQRLSYNRLKDQPTPPVASVNGRLGNVVLDAALVGAAPASHTHPQSAVDGLVGALAGKSPTGHGHTIADVAGLGDALAGAAAPPSFGTIAAMVASTAPLAVGQRITAAGFQYIVADPGVTDQHFTTAGGSKLYVDHRDTDTVLFDAWAPAKNGNEGSIVEGWTDDAIVVDDVPKLNQALAFTAALGKKLFVSPGRYGLATRIVFPDGCQYDAGNFHAVWCAKATFSGWMAETANFQAAYDNAQTDPAGDFHALTPKEMRLNGLKLEGNFQSFYRSFYRRPRDTDNTQGGIRLYVQKSVQGIRVQNVPGVGIWSYGKGGNGPRTVLIPGYSRQSDIRWYIDQTGGVGLRFEGPADIVIDSIYQHNAGARLGGAAAGQEDSGPISDYIYGATNGGYTDGVIFEKGCELTFIHSWGNRGGRGIMQYGGRLLSDICIAENNHFGGLYLMGGVGDIGIAKMHQNGAWRRNVANTEFDVTGANLYHNAGQTGGTNDSHSIGVLDIESHAARGTAREGGVVRGLVLGPNSRWFTCNGGTISMRNAVPGDAIEVEAGAAYFSIGNMIVSGATGDKGAGVMSAGVRRGGAGFGRIQAQVVNCATAYHNVGPSDPGVEDVSVMAALNAGQNLWLGRPGRVDLPGQRWQVWGRIGTTDVGLVKGLGWPIAAGPDATVSTLAQLESALAAVPNNLGGDYIIRLNSGTYGRTNVLNGYTRGTTRVRIQGDPYAIPANRPTSRGFNAAGAQGISFEFLNIFGDTMDEWGFPRGTTASGYGLILDNGQNFRVWGCHIRQWTFGISFQNALDLELGWTTIRECRNDGIRCFATSGNILRNVHKHHLFITPNAESGTPYPDLSIRGLSYLNDRRCAIDPRRSDQAYMAGYSNAAVENLAGTMVPWSASARDGAHPDCDQTAGPIQNFSWTDCLYEMNNIYGQCQYNNNKSGDGGGWAPAGNITYTRCEFRNAHNHTMAWQGDWSLGITLNGILIRNYPTQTWALNRPGLADEATLMRPGMSTRETTGVINSLSKIVVPTRSTHWHDYTKVSGVAVTVSNTDTIEGWASTDVGSRNIGHVVAPPAP